MSAVLLPHISVKKWPLIWLVEPTVISTASCSPSADMAMHKSASAKSRDTNRLLMRYTSEILSAFKNRIKSGGDALCAPAGPFPRRSYSQQSPTFRPPRLAPVGTPRSRISVRTCGS